MMKGFLRRLFQRLDGMFLRQRQEAVQDPEAGGARSAITIQRNWIAKKDPLQTRKSHTRFFLSSLSAREKTRTAGAMRGHWSVENRNHHKRDASAWQEDRHRHRKPNAALNLALARNVLPALIPFEDGQSLPTALNATIATRHTPFAHPQSPARSISLSANPDYRRQPMIICLHRVRRLFKIVA
jgi:predicted transposase YbfD/YdcC